MDKNLQVFDFESRQVRIVWVDGEPWFVAKDVCEALGITWGGDRINHVPEEWRGVRSVRTPSGMQDMTCLSEQGVYFFLARSDKPAALPFQKKIAGEILPSIRKTGGYMTAAKAEDIMNDPDIFIGLLQEFKKERTAKLALQAKVEKDAPKVEFYNAAMSSEVAVTMQEAAAILAFKNVGEKNLFKFLREDGILQWNNVPYRKFTDAEYFKTIERPYTTTYGRPGVYILTLVLQKGLVFIRNRLFNAGYSPMSEETMPRVQLPLPLSI